MWNWFALTSANGGIRVLRIECLAEFLSISRKNLLSRTWQNRWRF